MIIWSSSSSFSPHPSNNCNCNRNYACIQQVRKHPCTNSTENMLLNIEVHAGLHVKFSLQLSSVWGMIICFPGWLYCKYSCILTAKREGSITAVIWNHYTLGHPCWHCWQLFLPHHIVLNIFNVLTSSTLQGELKFWKETQVMESQISRLEVGCGKFSGPTTFSF